MHILLTNDDGIFATGIAAIYKKLTTLGTVTVVAPAKGESGASHSITLKPLVCNKVDITGKFVGYSVEGSPADCVKLGIMELTQKPFDLVVSGINDNPKLLASLLNQLIDIGILPYYVFQCRPVKRVKEHFSVPLYKGYQIFEAAKKKIKAHILCKRLKYIMSHKTGKVEMIGVLDDEIYFKYHQAKNPNNLGKFFKRKLNKTAAWLDELKK